MKSKVVEGVEHSNKKAMEALQHERFLVTCLRHPNIVHFEESYEDEKAHQVILVFEYFPCKFSKFLLLFV